MDAGDILGHCWCLRKVLAKSLSMPPLAYSPPASPDADLPDSPTPCGHEAPVLWRTDSTFFLVGGGLAWAPAGPPRSVLVSVPKASQGRPPSEVALPLAFQPRVHTCTAPRPVSCSVRRWKYGKSYDDAESCCITQNCYFFFPSKPL